MFASNYLFIEITIYTKQHLFKSSSTGNSDGVTYVLKWISQLIYMFLLEALNKGLSFFLETFGRQH